MEYKWLLIIVGTGLVAGLIAQMFVPGRGFGLGATIVIGVVGGWLGQKFLSEYIDFAPSKWMNEMLCATAGAIVLSLIINILRPGKDKDKTGWRNNS